MTPERWRQIDRVFQAAVALEPGEREPYLDGACSGDAELRRDVDEMLAADATESCLLDGSPFWIEPAGAGRFSRLPQEGERLGAYRLERQIGKGGMGVVYLARRDDERYERRVAIKVLKAPFVSRGMVARFRNEYRILADLEHPNIARLYDVGELDGETPWVVMEYVDGERIDAYCDRLRLSLPQRLRLFLRVCSAVGYAHRQLVVHRDLKPGNILVTPEGEPKLLDFGIAKLLDSGAADGGADATVTWQRAMTPPYASPEQIRGERVTTASDVYSLGVLLYKLLTGKVPFSLEGRSLVELSRFFDAGPEPPRPSVVVASAAGEGGDESALRGVTPRQLRHQLAGDLDGILLAALDADPERRYPSVEQLAQDVERHLEGLPVRARPATLPYRAGKLLRRHRLAFAATGLFLAVVLGFTVLTAVQSRRVLREKNRAEEVLAFFTDLFEVSNPGDSLGETVTVKDVLDRGVERARWELAGSPDVQATMLDTLGVVHTDVGFYAAAKELIEEGLALRRRLEGEESAGVATGTHNLARVLFKLGEIEESEASYRRALELQRRLLGERHPDVAETLSGLAAVEADSGDFEAAEAHARQALDIRRAAHGPRHRRVAKALGELGQILRSGGKLAEAEAVLEEALALQRVLYGAVHPEVATSLAALGLLHYDLGRYDDAEDRYRQALAMQREIWRDEHPSVAVSLSLLAQALDAKGDLAGSEEAYRESLELQKVFVGDRHPDYATNLANLALLLQKEGELAEAEALYRQSLEIRLETLGEDHRYVANSRYNLASLLHRKGDLEAAERLYRLANEGFDRALPAGHHNLAFVKIAMGRLLADRGRPVEAEPWLREGVEITRRALPAGHWRIAVAEVALGRCLADLGAFDQAEPLLLGGHARLQAAMGDENRHTRLARKRLAALYRAMDRPELAARYGE